MNFMIFLLDLLGFWLAGLGALFVTMLISKHTLHCKLQGLLDNSYKLSYFTISLKEPFSEKFEIGQIESC